MGCRIRRQGTPSKIAFQVEDVDRLILQLRTQGVRISREPFDTPAGNRTAYIEDPDGTWISLYQHLGAQ